MAFRTNYQTQQDVTALQQTVASIQRDGTTLQLDVAAIKHDVAALKHDVAGLKGDVAALKGDVAAIKHDITDLKQAFAESSIMTRAELFNLRAQMQNAKLFKGTHALTVMRSVEPGPNPLVQLGQRIASFPRTPNAIHQMNVHQCHDLLRSLDWPIPEAQGLGQTQPGELEFRAAVKEAVGLPAI